MANKIIVEDCPFCGSKASDRLIDVETWEHDPSTYFVQCNDCHAQGPFSQNIIDAIDLWGKANRVK